MASNKELMADITALCLERSVAVPDGLEQLKNPRLVELLDSLRQAPLPVAAVETPLRPLVAVSPPDDQAGAEAGAGSADAVAGGPPPAVVTTVVAPLPSPSSAAPAAPAAAPAPSPQPTGASGYYVAAGKTVHTLNREVQGAYQEVYAADFVDGQATIDGYVASGYLFKR